MTKPLAVSRPMRGRGNNVGEEEGQPPTSERKYQIGQKGECGWDAGTGIACEARNGNWDDEHGVYHLERTRRLHHFLSNFYSLGGVKTITPTGYLETA
jgi:hypothetical protein